MRLIVARVRLTSDNDRFFTSPAEEVSEITLITSDRAVAEAAAKKITDDAAAGGRKFDEAGRVYECADAETAAAPTTALVATVARQTAAAAEGAMSWPDDYMAAAVRRGIEQSGVISAVATLVADREYAAAMNGPASVNYADASRHEEEVRKLLLGG